MECPRCKKKGLFYDNEPKKRQRDGAIVVVRVCHNCGYSKNQSVVFPEPVLMDRKRQLLFSF